LKLLFIPPSGAGVENWLLQTSHFSGSEAISLPGHPAGKPLDSIEEYTAWLHHYIHRRGYQDVVLAGHSFGSAVALMYSLQYPAELKGQVLIGSGAKLKASQAYYTAVKSMLNDEDAWRKYNEKFAVSDPRLKPATEAKIRIGPAVLFNDLLCCDKFNVMDRLHNVRAPTLIIVGAEDEMTPVKFAQYLADRITGSKMVIIKGATHAVAMEKPDEVNRLIQEWADTIHALC
jgi:pimeloyl-ACP methyl ester carboxylesterase